jgi:hypothetical protein
MEIGTAKADAISIDDEVESIDCGKHTKEQQAQPSSREVQRLESLAPEKTKSNPAMDEEEEKSPQKASVDPFQKYIFTKSMMPSEEELYSKNLKSIEAKKMVKRGGRNWIQGIRLRECLAPSHDHRPGMSPIEHQTRR